MLLNPHRFGAVAAIAIGDSYQGGIYVGDVTISSVIYRVIVAVESEGASYAWKTTASATAGTTSTNDGAANTAAMIAAGAAAHPAAQYCVNYAGGGYTDWYLPSKDELARIMTNRAVLATPLGLTVRWWSSTQHTTTSTAWAHDMYSGGSPFNYSKTASYHVRPCRKVIKT